MTTAPLHDSAAAYRAAGVDLDRADAVVDVAKRHAKTTHQPFVRSEIGTFSGAFAIPAGYQEPILLAATDGVGTKLAIAQALNDHSTIGVDLVAMCVNDLLVQGGQPLAFLDYVAVGRIDVPAFDQILGGIAQACRETGCALLGGETAEMPGFYPDGKYDVAGFSVGVVERSRIYPRTERLQAGQALIGLASSGVHSNGFSLVRKILADQGLTFESVVPDVSPSASIGQVLLAPTRLYVSPVLNLLAAYGEQVHGMCHITGGGLVDNLPRVLPAHLKAEICWGSWQKAPVFEWLQRAGSLSQATMARTFNSGIGFVLVVDAEATDAVMGWLQANAPAEWAPSVIGTLSARGADEEAVVLRD